MSQDAGPSRSRRWLPGVLTLVVLGAAVGLGWFLATGTTRLPPTQRRVQNAVQPADDALDAARQVMLREPTYANCKSFLQQVDDYLERHPEQRSPGLTEAEYKVLRDDFAFPEWIKEFAFSKFGPQDAKYLEWSLLFTDVRTAWGFDDLPERERAAAAFAWVVRQVRIDKPRGDDFQKWEPLLEGYFPQQLLGRGAGPRDLVFLAVLEQLRIPGCRISWNRENGKRGLQGAVIGDQIYLFDAVRAVPVTGSQGQATLAEVCAKPEALQALETGTTDFFEFDPKEIIVHRFCNYCGVLPRMRLLEQQFATGSRPRLSFDAQGYSERYSRASRELPRSAPEARANWRDSMILFGSTPLEEGGATERKREPGEPFPASTRFYTDLIPWDHLPGPIRSLEMGVNPGARLRALFAAPFENFYLKPGSPRDLLVRGRLEQAATALVELRDQLQEVRRKAHETPNLEATVTEWCAAARSAQAEVFAAQGKGAASQAAQQRLQQLWSKEQVGPVLLLLHASAAEPLGVEVEYQLALCKHEQAERLQILHDHKKAGDAEALREAWRSAAERWQKFLADHPQAPGEGSARLMGARALEHLGDREAALALVQGVDHLPPWDRRACRYRAKLLAAQKK